MRRKWLGSIAPLLGMALLPWLIGCQRKSAAPKAKIPTQASSTQQPQIQRPEPSAQAVQHYQTGMKAKEAKDYDTALTELTKAVELAPHYAEAHFALAWVWMAKRERDKAIAEFTEGLRLAPEGDDGKEAKAALVRLGVSAVATPSGVAGPSRAGDRRGETEGPPIQLTLLDSAKEEDGMRLRVQVEPATARLEGMDLVTVYLTKGHERLSPEAVLAKCNRIGLFADKYGGCFYSTVTDRKTQAYVGQIAIRTSPGKMVTKDGVIEVRVSPVSPALIYKGTGTLHLWLKKQRGKRVSNRASADVQFGDER